MAYSLFFSPFLFLTKKPVPKTKSQLRRQKLNLKQQQQKKQEQEEPKTNKTVKVLLGELYGDKEYLEKLLQDKGRLRPLTVAELGWATLFRTGARDTRV